MTSWSLKKDTIMKKIFLILLFLPLVNFAQQDTQYTQFMYNTITINPAYAGSRGMLSVFGLHRSQWMGLEGAPKNTTISIETPLNKSNLGLGISLLNNKIGPTNENTLATDLSYAIRTSETFKLSFGIKAAVNVFNLDVNQLSLEDQDDEQFQNLKNKITPNIGAGIYWYSDKLYLGFSVPNFIQTSRYDANDVAIFKHKLSYYFMAGYNFDLDYYLKFKPALLAKKVEGDPLQVDLSGNFMFYDKVTLGVSYRFNGSISTMAGFQVSKGLYLGYGYSHETSSLSKNNSGSHEIFLRYDFIKKK